MRNRLSAVEEDQEGSFSSEVGYEELEEAVDHKGLESRRDRLSAVW